MAAALSQGTFISPSLVKKAIAKKLVQVNSSHDGRPPLDCNTVLTLCLEIIDALQNDTPYYMQTIYESALLSENRKMMESLQSDLTNQIEDIINEDMMPVPIEDIRYAQEKILHEMNTQFLEGLNQLTMGKPALEFYFELQNNVQDYLSNKIKENDDLSLTTCKNFLDDALGQITEVEDLTEADLRSPLLMVNLEDMFTSLIDNYVNKTRGSSQCMLD